MRATKLTALTAATLFSITLAACGNGDSKDSSAAPAPTMTTDSPAMMSPSASPSAATDAMMNFGAGCAAVPTDPANKGSFQAMAQVPVATAASGNPVLSTLVTAVTKAGLVDTLNSAPAITVFAPANDAFKAIPAAALNKTLADKAALTKLLTYHVVAGKLTPAELPGMHKTLEGGSLTVTGSGTDFKVDGKASVICGNVQTANATVYIIDSVLMPKS